MLFLMKHEINGHHANKAQSEAECFISIKAARWVLLIELTVMI